MCFSYVYCKNKIFQVAYLPYVTSKSPTVLKFRLDISRCGFIVFLFLNEVKTVHGVKVNDNS